MEQEAEKNINLLIVEDEKNVGDLLKEFLSAENRTITLANDGAEAIRELSNLRYDLIVTDIMMPGASGIEVLRAAKALYPHILVIIITGYASLETAIEAVREGAYDYLRKPFRLDEIKISVNNACEKIRLIRENSLLIQNLKKAYDELKKLGDEDAQAKNQTTKHSSPGTGNSALEIFPRHVVPPSFFEGEVSVKRIIADLERIIRLKEAGLLDEEEFNTCKKLLFEMAR